MSFQPQIKHYSELRRNTEIEQQNRRSISNCESYAEQTSRLIVEVLEEVQELRSGRSGEDRNGSVGGKRRKMSTDSDYEDKLTKVQKVLEEVQNSFEKVEKKIDNCGHQTEKWKTDSIKVLVGNTLIIEISQFFLGTLN